MHNNKKTIILGLVILVSTLVFLHKKIIRIIFYPVAVNMSHGLGENTKGIAFDHSIFDQLLKENVDKNGVVNYGKFQSARKELKKYLNKLAIVNLKNLSRYAQLALLINAYNAFTIDLILRNKNVKSIRDITSDKRWLDKRYVIAGQTYSLEDLEHKIIRPVYQEPRIHFAIVCASKSCPHLRTEAYTGILLLQQLKDQTVKFLHRSKNMTGKASSIIDNKNKVIYLSSLFDWFRDDFKTSQGSVLNFVKQYLLLNKKVNLENYTIEYLNYDWSLNGHF